MPTVFDNLDERLCRLLVVSRMVAMGAALATYYPERLPDTPLDAPPLTPPPVPAGDIDARRSDQRR